MVSSLTKKEIFVGVLVAALFVLVAYYTDVYRDNLLIMLGRYEGVWGMLFYVFITVIAVVFAPVSTMPMLPLAAMLFGVYIAALLSILGWTIGSIIAFLLARQFGRPFVRKFGGLKKVQDYAEHISHHHLFWSVVLLRVAMPVDVLSYALGLFSQMSLISFIIATIIGIAPFAFIFSYVTVLSVWYQIAAFSISGILVYWGYKKVRGDIERDSSK